MCSETSLGLDDLRKSFYSSGLQSELQDFSWPFPCRTSVLEATCAYSGCCDPGVGGLGNEKQPLLMGQSLPCCFPVSYPD